MLNSSKAKAIDEQNGMGKLFNQAVFHGQTISVAEGQNLGNRSAINPSQTHMVISSPTEETKGYNSGAVYLFEKVNGEWQEISRLLPPWQKQNLYFGISVAISDTWIAVGMPVLGGPWGGQVLIYDLNGQLVNVISEGNTVDAEFGFELDIYQDSIIVSAKKANLTGRVWIYQYNESSQIWQGQELINPMPQNFAEFGTQVKFNQTGDLALVTASFHDFNGVNNAGIAHLYSLSNGTWQHLTTLEPSLPFTNGNLGYKADFSSEVIALNQGFLTGATNDDMVFIYEKDVNDDWVQTEVFHEFGYDARYGFNVSVDDTKLVVVQNPGVQINYRSGYNQWTHQEAFDPNTIDSTVNSFGSGSVFFTDDFLVGSSFTNGVTFLEQLNNLNLSGGCSNPIFCQWHVQDRVDRSDISDSRIGDQFGVSVDVSGDMAVIGVYADDDKGENAGAVYVYRYQPFINGNQWFTVSKLYASDGKSGDQFGRHVAIDEDRILIGAYLDDVFSNDTNTDVVDAGSVYVFENVNEQWIETQKIHSEEGTDGTDDRFGFAFDFNQSRLLVGAYQDDENGQNSGAVYAYVWTGSQYVFTEKIMPMDGQVGDGFGYSVSLDGNKAIIGAYLADAPGLNVGAAYIYNWLIPPINGWIEQDKLLPSSAVVNSDTVFGAAVSISNDIAVVGAPKHELSPINDVDRGTVFVFQKDTQSNTWDQIQALSANDNQDSAQFGRSVSLEGNRLLVGAWLHDFINPNNNVFIDAGSAFFYRWNPIGGDFQTGGWQLGAELTAAFPTQQSVFGHAVAVSEEKLLIGAHRTGSTNFYFGNAEYFVDDMIFATGF
ncbi:MAG: FG-GAP repeat protein [Marinicella sp.]